MKTLFNKTNGEIIQEVINNIRMGCNWVTEEYLINEWEIANNDETPDARQYLELKNACTDLGIRILSEVNDIEELEELTNGFMV